MLSQRLKSLEAAGVIERRAGDDGSEYFLTAAGQELGPIVMQLGVWGQRWARSQLTPEDYDPALLMWDVRRNVDVSSFPAGRTVVFFEFTDAPRKTRYWWLVVEHGEVDLCLKNPGHEIDLHLRTTVQLMVDIWMGEANPRGHMQSGELQVSGVPALKKTLPVWLGYSVFAHTA